ncbi:MAG: hypothetical protein HY785_17645 [Oscillatoriophycideae cyanobacterium NC_groundwater_1537_Pr4_S-0.65um_50_18]|nr:hypothetical protein [Oscillatoriophycideae cyanobacterium NC_groundwater_1537_Pr4_S-0.65um_50_18]
MTTSSHASPSDPQNLSGGASAASAPAKAIVSSNPQRTLLMSRRIGYSLLVLCLVDLIYVIVPPEFTNPVWEYQTAGDLIKLVPVPLLAMMLLFYGETALRSRLERLALFILSWTTLVVGVLLLLLIPLVITDAARINQFNDTQITTQVTQQTIQLDSTKKQLEQATQQQLASLVPRPDQAGNLPDMPKTPAQAKTQILVNIDRAKTQAQAQADEARGNVRRNLLKNTIKLTLQSFLSGFTFIYIWIRTDWARRAESYRNEQMRSSSLSRIPQLFKGNRRRRL